METPRQGAATAVARTTPGVLGRSARMILWAARVREPPGLTVRCEAWDAKKRVTFAETLAMVRRWRWAEPYLQRSHTAAARRKVPRALYERLTETLCYAA